jgi:hypothetical protein
MKIGQSAGKSYGYILGVYLGDGCVTTQPSKNSGPEIKRYPVFRVNTIDGDFAEAIKDALGDLSDRKVAIHKHEVSKSSKPNYAVRCGDPDLCRKLVEDTNSKQSIPFYVWNWTKSEKLAFIAGLMDSEGFISKKTGSERTYYMGFKCCESWVPELAKLLESVGIRSGRLAICPPAKDGYRTPMRFHIKLESWVREGAYFKIMRKQQRVMDWAASRQSSTTNMPNTALR